MGMIKTAVAAGLVSTAVSAAAPSEADKDAIVNCIVEKMPANPGKICGLDQVKDLEDKLEILMRARREKNGDEQKVEKQDGTDPDGALIINSPGAVVGDSTSRIIINGRPFEPR